MENNYNDNNITRNENNFNESYDPNLNITHSENMSQQEVFITSDPIKNNEDINQYKEATNENSYINFKNVPVKKNNFKKVVPLVICTLISSMLGGIIGGAYVNKVVSKNNYTTPISISTNQNTQTGSITNYTTPSNSLIAKIAADVSPSIVCIDTETVTSGFFGSSQTSQGSGSGIIFDKNGYIVTNQHVIDGAKKIVVTLPGGKQFDNVKIVGADPRSDIAVLKVDATDLPVAIFGDSSQVRVGDLAIAIGNPLGDDYAGTVTSGIISALNRKMTISDGQSPRLYTLLQTDAAINPGNSGGALLNERGEVIGINSVKFVDQQVEGMGFAIPSNDVKLVIEELIQKGYVSWPYIGIQLTVVTPDMAKQNNYPTGIGVVKVYTGSAAEKAGIKPLDIITKINDVKTETDTIFMNELYKHKVGDTIKLEIWRDGKTLSLDITLDELKDNVK